MSPCNRVTRQSACARASTGITARGPTRQAWITQVVRLNWLALLAPSCSADVTSPDCPPSLPWQVGISANYERIVCCLRAAERASERAILVQRPPLHRVTIKSVGRSFRRSVGRSVDDRPASSYITGAVAVAVGSLSGKVRKLLGGGGGGV